MKRRWSIARHRVRLVLASLPFLVACNLSNVMPAAIPTPDLPRVQILSPDNNTRIQLGESLTLEVLAQDETDGIVQVRLYVDDPVGERRAYTAATVVDGEPVPIFRASLLWSGERVKSYLLSVVAYRADGQRSDSASITVHVED